MKVLSPVYLSIYLTYLLSIDVYVSTISCPTFHSSHCCKKQASENICLKGLVSQPTFLSLAVQCRKEPNPINAQIWESKGKRNQSQSLINVVEELGGQMFPFLSPGWTTLRHSTWLLIFIYLFGCIRSQLWHS